MSATDHWSRIDETAVQDDALWPAKMGFKSREEVIVWRRTFRRASRSFAEKGHKARTPAVKTEAELAQLLDYLEGAPEMQQAAIEAQREAQREQERIEDLRQAASLVPKTRNKPAAVVPIEADPRALLYLDVMQDVLVQAIERLLLFKEFDGELDAIATLPPQPDAPDINRPLSDLAAMTQVLGRVMRAISLTPEEG